MRLLPAHSISLTLLGYRKEHIAKLPLGYFEGSIEVVDRVSELEGAIDALLFHRPYDAFASEHPLLLGNIARPSPSLSPSPFHLC